MIAVLVLAFAAVAAVAGPRLLDAAAWPARRPAWGIWAWQTLSLSVAFSLVLAGAIVAIPETPLRGPVAALLRACSDALAEHYATPGGKPVAFAAAALSLLVVARLTAVAVRDMRAASTRRAAQRDVLTLVGRPQAEGFTVVDHAAPLVYCLPGSTGATGSIPGGPGTVVVTSAARAALTERQLELVLAHERQHLRARHHLALTLSAALARAFAGCGVFGLAHERIAALAEMQADDAVVPHADRRDLARALLCLNPASPATGVAVASSTNARAVQRVHRLTEPAARPRRGATLATAACGIAVLVTPAGLALVPAVEAAVRDCCPATIAELPTTPNKTDADHPGMHSLRGPNGPGLAGLSGVNGGFGEDVVE